MRSIFVLLILVMIGLNGKGQSVTALPDSVLSQCCLEVTLLNGNVTTVDWVFIQYVTRDGAGTKLFVEYAPNFGGIQWETQIRIQDDFDGVLERSKFIMLPFTVGSTDYAINRNWIANIEENTTTGGTWIYGRFGTPTKRKFSAVEDYEYLKNLLLLCRPRAIIVAENGLYTEGDTVRMGGFLIENTSITTEGYNWQMKDTLSSVEFGLDYLTPETLDTTVYWARRSGSLRQMVQLGRRYYYNSMRDTTGGLYSDFTHSWNSGDPFLQYQIFNPSAPTTGTAWFKIQKDNSFLNLSNDSTNPFYSLGWAVTNTTASLGASESGSGDPGNGVVMGAYGFGTTEFLFMKTKAVDAGTATNGQYLQLIDNSSGEVDFATIDLSGYLPIADTAAMLLNYPSTAGYGIIDGGKTWRADTTSPSGLATRLFAKTLPTTIAANYAAVSNGTNLIARNLFDNNTYAGVISRPWKFGEYTTAGLPTGVTGYTVYNTTIGGIGWYDATRWNYVPKAVKSAFTSTYIPFTNSSGQFDESANLTYTGTRLQTGGSFRIGRANVSNDTISMEKFEDGNSRVFRVNNPGSTGGWGSGFVFRGGFNGVISSANTFRIYTNSSTLPGSVYIGNVTEGGASAANSSINLGILNKITSTGTYDTGLNINPNGLSPNNFTEYALTNSKQFGIFIGGQGGTNSLRNFSDIGYGVYAGYQYQPTVNGYGSSWVFLAKTEASAQLEILRLQGKDGNICLGCTNAQYKLYTTSTDAYGLPRGTVAQRPTIVASTTPIRYNTDSTALEYGESVGTWRQLATRAYARSLVNAISIANIGNTNLSLTGNRTLHGAGYSLAFNANTTVRDSFIIGNLPEFNSEYITISDNSTGLQGKKKFLMQSDSAYNGTSSGFFFDNGIIGKQISGDNYSYLDYADTTGFFEQSVTGTNSYNGVIGNGGAGGKYRYARIIENSQIIAFDMGLDGIFLNSDNMNEIFKADTTGIIRFSQYGAYTKTASSTSKTNTNLNATFATDGTLLEIERKRDTTVYVVDTDLDWSAAITTAQIASRYNRVIFLITTTAAAGSNSDLTLHTPDVNLMQCEYLIRSTDEAGGFTNTIQFGSNNAVDSGNTLVSSYTPAPGQGVGIRAGLRSGVYKYWYY